MPFSANTKRTLWLFGQSGPENNVIKERRLVTVAISVLRTNPCHFDRIEAFSHIIRMFHATGARPACVEQMRRAVCAWLGCNSINAHPANIRVSAATLTA